MGLLRLPSICPSNISRPSLRKSLLLAPLPLLTVCGRKSGATRSGSVVAEGSVGPRPGQPHGTMGSASRRPFEAGRCFVYVASTRSRVGVSSAPMDVLHFAPGLVWPGELAQSDNRVRGPGDRRDRRSAQCSGNVALANSTRSRFQAPDQGFRWR